MPLYSMSRAHAPDEVAKLEAKGEIVVQVIPDGPTLLVITEPVRVCMRDLETR